MIASVNKSEWPKIFLLDELWLKTRRVVVHKLEENNLWLCNNDYIQFYNSFKESGEKIKQEVLLTVLGEHDYSIINSESAFRLSNQQLRTKIPFALSFGYSIGEFFLEIFNKSLNKESTKEICSLCALFNLGISIFDLLNDQLPLEFDELSKIFPLAILRSMNKGRKMFPIHDQLYEIEKTEIRILLKIINHFYDQLYQLIPGEENIGIDRKLQNYLERAYKAELLSKANGHIQSLKHLKKISKEKSVLPFWIMGLIVTKQHVNTFDRSEELNQLSILLGNIFHLIDDLSDLISDFNLSDINTIWLEIINEDYRKDSSLDYSAVDKIISNYTIERYTNKLSEHILVTFSKIENLLNGDEEKILMLKKTILFYVRKWLS